MRRSFVFFAVFAFIGCVASIASAQVQVTKETVPGITNFSRVQTTIACAGATTPEAVAEVKKMGFSSIVNLRQSTEAGANVEAEEAAAKAAGLKYISLPVNTASPDPAMVERFLSVIVEPANQPVFLHCASANRAAAFWMIKRIVVDKWDDAKATEEATALGLTNAALKTFALDYAHAHTR